MVKCSQWYAYKFTTSHKNCIRIDEKFSDILEGKLTKNYDTNHMMSDIY